MSLLLALSIEALLNLNRSNGTRENSNDGEDVEDHLGESRQRPPPLVVTTKCKPVFGGNQPGVEALGLLSSRAELQCPNFGQSPGQTTSGVTCGTLRKCGNQTLRW